MYSMFQLTHKAQEVLFAADFYCTQSIYWGLSEETQWLVFNFEILVGWILRFNFWVINMVGACNTDHKNIINMQLLDEK